MKETTLSNGITLSRDGVPVTPMTTQQIGRLRAGIDWARSALVLMLVLFASACVTAPTKAKFNHYTLQVVASEANGVVCKYGKTQIANYAAIPRGKTYTTGTWGYPFVHPELTCRWLAANDTPRQEVVPMEKLLLPPYVSLEGVEGQVVRDVPPIQGSPNVLVEINDRTIRVVMMARVRLEGERITPGSQRIRIQVISKVLYESDGTKEVAP